MTDVHYKIAHSGAEEFVTLPEPGFFETRANQLINHCRNRGYNLAEVFVLETANKKVHINLLLM